MLEIRLNMIDLSHPRRDIPCTALCEKESARFKVLSHSITRIFDILLSRLRLH